MAVHGIFYVLTLKVRGYYFYYTLLFKVIIKFQPVARGRDSSSSLGSDKVFEEYVVRTGGIVASIFEKHNALH